MSGAHPPGHAENRIVFPGALPETRPCALGTLTRPICSRTSRLSPFFHPRPGGRCANGSRTPDTVPNGASSPSPRVGPTAFAISASAQPETGVPAFLLRLASASAASPGARAAQHAKPNDALWTADIRAILSRLLSEKGYFELTVIIREALRTEYTLPFGKGELYL